MGGCLGRKLAHLEGSHTLGMVCSLLARRPAGADRFQRRDREGVVGCLQRMLAHLGGSHKVCQISSLLARRPAGADRIARGTAKVWSAASGESLSTLEGHTSFVG